MIGPVCDKIRPKLQPRGHADEFDTAMIGAGEIRFYVVQDGDRQETLGIAGDGHRCEWRFEDLYEAAKDRERKQVPIESLGILDVDIWFARAGKEPTLRNIAEEVKRIARTNSTFPAIIVAGLGLVDGTHRAVKAYLAGRETLECVELTMEELHAIPHVTKPLPPEAEDWLGRQLP